MILIIIFNIYILGYPLDTTTDLDFETLPYMLSDKKNDKQGVDVLDSDKIRYIVATHVHQRNITTCTPTLIFKEVNEMVNEQIIDISGP